MSVRSGVWWRRVLNPKVLLPFLVGSTLLGLALSLADLPSVMGNIRLIPPSRALAAFALAMVYLLFKGLELGMLLEGLGIRTGWRSLVLSYVIGELTLTLPLGVYAQNYVLQRIRGFSFARSAAATTLTLAIEAAVVLVTLGILGIPGREWVRPTVLGGMAACGLGLLLIGRAGECRHRVALRMRNGRYKKLGQGLLEMVEGIESLLRPGYLVVATLLTVVYLAALVGAFQLVAQSVGAPGLDFMQATTIYFAALGLALVSGSFVSQVGEIEFVGMSVAGAWGHSLSLGLAMLLGFRLVWVASIWIVCIPLLVALRGELGHAQPLAEEGSVSEGEPA